jgi:hypothetical protein
VLVVADSVPDGLLARLQVFLNVPYDGAYQPLFLAAIAGLCGLGLTPRAALELPTSQRRLDRITRILRQCRYSLHDLSQVELSGGVPRFNMPFELGVAIAMRRRGRHDWWVLESHRYRLQRSLSDLNGTDPLVHGGSPRRLLQILDNTFARPRQLEIPLSTVLDLIGEHAVAARRRYGGLYTAGAFRSLVIAATALSNDLRQQAVRRR